MRRDRRGAILHTVIAHIILIVIVFSIFFIAMESKFGSRSVKQQVLEKQLALLIDAADEGAKFEVMRKNANGLVDDVSVRAGNIYVSIEGFPSSRGYSYFSKYPVRVEKEDSIFVVVVG